MEKNVYPEIKVGNILRDSKRNRKRKILHVTDEMIKKCNFYYSLPMVSLTKSAFGGEIE